MSSLYRHLGAALGSWWAWVSTVVAAISVFRLAYKIFDFGLSEVIGDIIDSYALIFHFPFKFALQFFSWKPPEYAYDAAILWVILAGALVRTIQQFAKARVSSGKLYTFTEFMKVLREDFKSEDSSFFSKTVSALIAAYVVLAGPTKGIAKKFWSAMLVLISIIFLPLLLAGIILTDLRFQLKTSNGSIIDMYARVILFIQTILLVACVAGISALNSATM